MSKPKPRPQAADRNDEQAFAARAEGENQLPTEGDDRPARREPYQYPLPRSGRRGTDYLGF
jgi:hypothetical protein